MVTRPERPKNHSAGRSEYPRRTRIGPGVVVAVGGPSWSPDGRNIAFAAQNIYVGQPSTGDATRLTHPDTGAQLDDRCPAWSPDGRRMPSCARSTTPQASKTVTDWAIVVAQADGSHQRLLGDG